MFKRNDARIILIKFSTVWSILKACLIFPNIYLGNYFAITTPIHIPLGLGYLSAVLREAGHDVLVIDAAAEKLSLPKLVKRLGVINPDVIGITTNISSSRIAIMTARFIKKNLRHIPIIMGGPWATIEYEKVLQKNIADYVVVGEGERTIVELLTTIRDPARLKDVNGIAFKDKEGSIVKTKARECITDLDSLPFPAWDLFPPSKKYNFSHRKKPFFPIMTTRGCPFDCIHCTKVVHGYTYRKRSIENVIQEIRYLKEKFNIKELFIIDDCFNLDLGRAEKILDEIIASKFDLNIKFSNGIRADRITPRFAQKLKMAGTYFAALGIESGSQEIVNKIGKKLDLKKVILATRILKRFKIIPGGFFILGHPYDNYETMIRTVNFAKSLDLDYPHFFKAIPFPGTKMYDMVVEHGRFIDDAKRGSTIDGYTSNAGNFEIWNLKTEDIAKAFKLAYRLVYLRPRKILQLVSQFRSIHDVEWVITEFLLLIVKNLF